MCIIHVENTQIKAQINKSIILSIEKIDSFNFADKESIKYTLFEEILSSRKIEDILLT